MNAQTPIPLRADYGATQRAAMTSLTRAVLSVALRNHSRSNIPHADKILREDKSADLVLKAATSPATLAGNAALTQIALAFVNALIPVSASAALIARSLQLQFGDSASVSVPGLSLPSAAWVGEGQAIPVQQGVSSIAATLEPYKLGVILELTGEMLRNSNAEALIRAVLISSVGPSLDAALLSNAAGVPVYHRPAFCMA